MTTVPIPATQFGASLQDVDRHWLSVAIDVSRLSPPSPTHYAVGAVIVAADGELLATGYTGETLPAYHAEEAALAKLAGRDLTGATIYSSLEPCTLRRSRPTSCTSLILTTGIARVVLALREPDLFADCDGVSVLDQAGIAVIEYPALGPLVRDINAHLFAG